LGLHYLIISDSQLTYNKKIYYNSFTNLRFYLILVSLIKLENKEVFMSFDLPEKNNSLDAVSLTPNLKEQAKVEGSKEAEVKIEVEKKISAQENILHSQQPDVQQNKLQEKDLLGKGKTLDQNENPSIGKQADKTTSVASSNEALANTTNISNKAKSSKIEEENKKEKENEILNGKDPDTDFPKELNSNYAFISYIHPHGYSYDESDDAEKVLTKFPVGTYVLHQPLGRFSNPGSYCLSVHESTGKVKTYYFYSGENESYKGREGFFLKGETKSRSLNEILEMNKECKFPCPNTSLRYQSYKNALNFLNSVKWEGRGGGNDRQIVTAAVMTEEEAEKINKICEIVFGVKFDVVASNKAKGYRVCIHNEFVQKVLEGPCASLQIEKNALNLEKNALNLEKNALNFLSSVKWEGKRVGNDRQIVTAEVRTKEEAEKINKNCEIVFGVKFDVVGSRQEKGKYRVCIHNEFVQKALEGPCTSLQIEKNGLKVLNSVEWEGKRVGNDRQIVTAAVMTKEKAEEIYRICEFVFGLKFEVVTNNQEKGKYRVRIPNEFVQKALEGPCASLKKENIIKGTAL